jgi:hypothetical protein
LKKLINVGGDRDLLKLPDLPTLREGKVKLYTDPNIEQHFAKKQGVAEGKLV